MADEGNPAGTGTPGTPAGGTNPNPAAGTQPAGDPAAGTQPAGTPAGAAPAGIPDGDGAAPGEWPGDWRNRMAGGDEKALKRLERYASPKAAIDALFSVQSKISAGELRSTLKPNATPDEVKAWRADNGIPETPEGYELKLENGMEISEFDKPLVDDFLKIAHERNIPPAQVNDMVNWFMSTQERGAAELAARDKQDEIAVHSELRAEMGPDYQVNLKVALETLPPDLADEFMAARLPDGRALGNDLRVIRWLANMAREINPIAAVVPGSGVNASQAVDSEIGTLKKLMGDRKSEYWKGPNADKMQARYRELVNAQARGARR